eukprot:snap_masked-scaffold_22-processed-gene-0.39-mRNA-1 protein AED:0.01 eAED:0.03 QI:0/0/0/1/1/1/2/0/942
MSKKPVVSFQGVKGAYSQAAIHKLLGKNLNTLPCESFSDCFTSLDKNLCDYALLPIENSSGGSIHEVFDLQIKFNFHIIAEIDFPVHHCLLCLPNSASKIKIARSHYQALAQCQDYLISKNIKPQKDFDTAGSAEKIKLNGNIEEAAIASELAAEVYGLEILDKNIEDSDKNTTRFLLLSKKDIKREEEKKLKMKTSLVFCHKNVPGALHLALGVFASRGLDLTKLESRPNRFNLQNTEQTYPFVFFCDILAGCFPTDAVLVDFLPGEFSLAEKIQSKQKQEKTKIGILGFGNFGQFLSKTFTKYSKVSAFSRSDYSSIAKDLHVDFFRNLEEFLNQNLDILVISVAILALEKVLEQMKPFLHLLKHTLVIDVLSVKTFPKQKLMELRDENKEYFGIFLTHPMFGPESGKHSWSNLPMIYEPLKEQKFQYQADFFLDIFRKEGCRLVEMSCEEHDLVAANSQFVTHFLGRVVDKLSLEETEISTLGFKSLLTIRDHTVKDSWDLFQALFKNNPNSKQMIEKIKIAVFQLGNELENSLEFNSVLNEVHESKTAALFSKSKQMKLEGKDIVSSLAVGEPDFLPPRPVLDAMHSAINSGKLKYTPIAGIPELREKLAERYQNSLGKLMISSTNILVSSSGKQVFYQLCKGILNPGDKVIIPSPYWTSYPDIVRLNSGIPIIIESTIENNFIISAEELENFLRKHHDSTEKIRGILLCDPSNPTGAVYSSEQLRELAEVLLKPEFNHMFVFYDEIYSNLFFSEFSKGEQTRELGLRRSLILGDLLGKRLVRISGFSKNFALTGLRIGYLIAEEKIVKVCQKIQSQINNCAASVSQYAALAALDVPMLELYKGLEKKKSLVLDLVKQIPGVKFSVPLGAFYLFIDIEPFLKGKTSTQLSMILLEKFGVALPPGDAFGYPNGLRISFAASEEDIKEAMKRLRKGLQSM